MVKVKTRHETEIEYTPKELAAALGHKGAFVFSALEDAKSGKFTIILKMDILSKGHSRIKAHASRDEDQEMMC